MAEFIPLGIHFVVRLFPLAEHTDGIVGLASTTWICSVALFHVSDTNSVSYKIENVPLIFSIYTGHKLCILVSEHCPPQRK